MRKISQINVHQLTRLGYKNRNRPPAYDVTSINQHQSEPEVQSEPEANIVDLTSPGRNPSTILAETTDVEINVPFRRSHAFKGVTCIRKKAKSYIITGIDLESDEEGLE